jgi:hypothetical protein
MTYLTPSIVTGLFTRKQSCTSRCEIDLKPELPVYCFERWIPPTEIGVHHVTSFDFFDGLEIAYLIAAATADTCSLYTRSAPVSPPIKLSRLCASPGVPEGAGPSGRRWLFRPGPL